MRYLGFHPGDQPRAGSGGWRREAGWRRGRASSVPGRFAPVRLTDFWARLEQVFGAGYAASVAEDQVLTQLGGRTITQALREGEPTVNVWRAVVAAYPDRVPGKLR